MTPRTSVGADARAHFEELALQHPADPSGGGEETDLMARVRGLYEDSAVPVREIAARAGVTERTIYKYARKHGWMPRYQWQDDHPCVLVRGWQANDGYAPSQGAGGRFVRREDAGKPFARGLKAVDPAGRAEAAQRCAEAERIGRAAWQRAEHARLVREHRAAFYASDRAAAELIAFQDKHPPNRRDRVIEEQLLHCWELAVEATRYAHLALDQFDAEMAQGRAVNSAGAQSTRI